MEDTILSEADVIDFDIKWNPVHEFYPLCDSKSVYQAGNTFAFHLLMSESELAILTLILTPGYVPFEIYYDGTTYKVSVFEIVAKFPNHIVACYAVIDR